MIAGKSRIMSKRVTVAALLFLGASLLPLTISPTGEIRASSLCGSEITTCCFDPNSGCPGVGAGWYDTGCYGPCKDLRCPGPPKR